MDAKTKAEKEVFYAALAVTDSARRQVLLDSLCRDNLELRSRVDELLRAHEGTALRTPEPADYKFDAVETELPSGQMVGRYKLLEQIGEGGFGVVYMADQVEPVQRRVALKIIKAGMDTKQVIGRFEAERQALALMDHPNIAKVLDAGATETGRPYFVMELVRGAPVTEYCDDHSLSTDERLRLFMEICSAIQHAHQKGIIHRDLKPSNILVSSNGDQAMSKVIDFGIAKATQGRLTDKTYFTQFRQFMGTPTYVSPEQAQMSAVDVDTRSDIYSLGVLLYELLTGKTPFDSRELLKVGFEEMCRRIREVEPATPSTRLSSLSLDEKKTAAKMRRTQELELQQSIRGDLDWIVMKAIEKNRTRRYETADALKLDIQRFLSDEPVSAAAPSATYRASKFVRRNKIAILAATLFGLLLTIGTALATWQAIRATAQNARAEAAEKEALENFNLASENLALAKENELSARRQQYAAEMMVLQSNSNGLNSEQIHALLERQIPEAGDPDFRGFEWRREWNKFRRELFALEGHTDEIRCVAMSPNGRWLASGGTDGTARFWNVDARREIWQRSLGDHCNDVEFSPDGRYLATRWWSAVGPRKIVLWDVSIPASPKQLNEYDSFGRFSPDGETAISAGEPLLQWNIESEQVLHQYSDPAFKGTEHEGRSHKSGRLATTFSKDGQRLLTIGEDRAIKLWDAPTGNLLFSIDAKTEVYDGALSPLDGSVATVSIDMGFIQIFSEEGQELRQIEVANPLDRVRFSQDGKKLVASERFGRLHVFDTQTWEELTTFNSRGSLLALQLCSPIDSNVVVTAPTINASNTIRFWDISTKEFAEDFPDPVRDLQFSHDGSMLAVGMVNGAVQILNVAARSPIFTSAPTRSIGPQFREKPALTAYKPGMIHFSPDNKQMAVIGPKRRITLWSIDSQAEIGVIELPEGADWFFSLKYSSTGQHLYAGVWSSGEPGVYMWDLSQLEADPVILDHPDKVGLTLAQSVEAHLLASGGYEVRLWSSPDHRLIRTLDMSSMPKQVRGPLCLDFSPTGKWLAGGTPAGNVWLWDTESGSHRTLPMLSYVMSVDFSPNGRRLVAADMWSVVKMWDIKSLQSVATFSGSIAEFSPDGTMLAVGCETHLSSMSMPEAGRVRLYHAPTLAELDAE